MALFRNRRADKAEHQIEQLLAIVPAEVFQGKTIDSPYVESAPTARSLVPWRRNGRGTVYESALERTTPPPRQGYLADIPRGGSTEWNQGYAQIGGATDRRTLMEQMQQLYVACPWASACVDAIARFSTAGGMSIEPDDETNQRKETVVLSKQAQKAQDLFDYVNPEQNFRQLMRGVFSDLGIYGDSFVEVVWALGEPIALYSLPCPDMLVLSDEHGNIGQRSEKTGKMIGYVQRTETDQRAEFEPHQVIHIKYDSPRGGLYGLGPTEKTVHAITTWLFTEGLLKSTMEKGNPPGLAFKWDINLADNEIKKWAGQYRTKNMGAANVGNPVDLKGNTDVVQFHANAIAEYMATKAQCRDEICGGYGVPPAEVTIIESGNLGGGTGTAQRKTFITNTCGPVQELVLEAFTFAILQQGFGVGDYSCKFGEVDWRDDQIVEQIRLDRVKTGLYTINRGRDEIGEPPVDGGDDAVIIQTRDVVLVKDLAAMSEAAVEKATMPPINPIAATVPAIGDAPAPTSSLPTGKAPAKAAAPAKADSKEPAHAKGGPTEAHLDGLITEADGHTGAMVALFLPAKLAGELAIDGGEPADEMHVTLAYLGDAVDLGSIDDLGAVVAAWALETPPVAASISGVGLFNPQGDDNPPVTYASIDAPNLSGARHRLVDALKRAGFPPNAEHGFTPHCTLAYANVVDQVGEHDEAFTFGAVTLAVADNRQSWPLQGSVVESILDEAEFVEAWRQDFLERRAQALKELPKVGV